MSSLSPRKYCHLGNSRWACLGICSFLLMSLAACDNKDSRQTSLGGQSQEKMVVHGPGMLNPGKVTEIPYKNDRHTINEGRRLYSWFNCVGCHANGGGGMGPPLIDSEWIYGSEPMNIYASIVEGRPNGMPAFGDKIPEEEVWQLVAYVRSLGGLESGLLEGASNRPLQEETASDLDEGGF